MIEPIMYVGLGFLAASLLALVIIPLVHDRALRNQLHAAEQLLTKNGATADHILANKLARITADLDQRSALADSQRIEIVALKTQVDTLKDQLALAYSTRVGSVARR